MPIWLVDMILVGVLLEALFLGRLCQTRRPELLRALLLFLLSGALLLAALRASLMGAGLPAVGFLLFCGGIAHVFCLRAAWSAKAS
ncbi:MAG: hypothetical protein V2I43_05915 [Parvularcula sp.]|jgi:hypothetical protein|nr:hypothetical protein [Parvularcula sp.]